MDLIIGLALGDETPETYRTLQNNLERSHFHQREPSFRWARVVDGVTSLSNSFARQTPSSPAASTGPMASTPDRASVPSMFAALISILNDFIECEIEAERLDGGGQSHVVVRVANVLPYAVLEIFAFQQRHENKDSYDLVFTLLNCEGDPRSSGRAAAASPVAGHSQVIEALALLAERFRDVAQDGPSAYALFLGTPGDEDEKARLRQEAAATIRAFLRGFHEGRP